MGKLSLQPFAAAHLHDPGSDIWPGWLFDDEID